MQYQVSPQIFLIYFVQFRSTSLCLFLCKRNKGKTFNVTRNWNIICLNILWLYLRWEIKSHSSLSIEIKKFILSLISWRSYFHYLIKPYFVGNVKITLKWNRLNVIIYAVQIYMTRKISMHDCFCLYLLR